MHRSVDDFAGGRAFLQFSWVFPSHPDSLSDQSYSIIYGLDYREKINFLWSMKIKLKRTCLPDDPKDPKYRGLKFKSRHNRVCVHSVMVTALIPYSLMRGHEEETDSVVSHDKTGISVEICKFPGTPRCTCPSAWIALSTQQHGSKLWAFQRESASEEEVFSIFKRWFLDMELFSTPGYNSCDQISTNTLRKSSIVLCTINPAARYIHDGQTETGLQVDEDGSEA
ncbi:hypothetical protein PM082_007574 [Marasmius tenuissimus]|nr:hypothetical protein PM082_007574 [Marasmius tenuissimus]